LVKGSWGSNVPVVSPFSRGTEGGSEGKRGIYKGRGKFKAGQGGIEKGLRDQSEAVPGVGEYTPNPP